MKIIDFGDYIILYIYIHLTFQPKHYKQYQEIQTFIPENNKYVLHLY